MNISCGIVGLPNVGKSTLFNALLKKQIANVANYPFCTIEPNVGIIEVPDHRLSVLANIVHTSKIVPAIIEFYDIAGLVKGASRGEGLGNKFLSHIKDTALIIQVVRLFENEDIIHVDSALNPENDIEIIETELMLSDIAILEKQTPPKINWSKEQIFTYQIGQKILNGLNRELPARKQSLSEEEQNAVKSYNLLTIKPMIYLFNVSENQLTEKTITEKRISDILLKAGENPNNYLYLCASLESEILSFTQKEQTDYLSQFGLTQIGLYRLINKCYETLGLISFLTAGEIEARAWTIKKGTLAPQAAGTIHTDFEKLFIKADIVSYSDFVKYQGWQKAREQGKVQIVGKDYEMKDGEVVEFKIGK